MGVGGAGNRTFFSWNSAEVMRQMSLTQAIRNGFAAVITDAGNREEPFSDWGLNIETRELDWELIRNWAYRSTHDMTVIGKAVTKAIHGSAPLFSYFQGASGGGRQALMETQRYPNDYDGIWAADPAINWTKFIPAEIWPALVMKGHRNPLPPSKFEAFRVAVIEACGGEKGLTDNFLNTFDVEWNPHELVGKQTEAGEITATDATVMQKIWEGPKSEDGDLLWYGLLPGTESWGNNLSKGGLAVTTEVNGERLPEPFEMAKSYIGTWLLRDPEWDWTTLTFELFEELFQLSVREFAEIATDNPDLSSFRDSGGKLIISHGENDEVIFSRGSIDYYQRVQAAMDGEKETTSFARLFISPGDRHGYITDGPGLSLAGGMAALMEWVENGKEPDSILGEKFDLATGKVTMTRHVNAFR